MTGKSEFRAPVKQTKNKLTFLQSQIVGQDNVGCLENME